MATTAILFLTNQKQTNHRQQQRNVRFICCVHCMNTNALSVHFKLNRFLFDFLCLHLKKQAVNVVATEFDTMPTRFDIEKRFFCCFVFGMETNVYKRWFKYEIRRKKKEQQF